MNGYPFPGIGVVFDIDALGGGFYGREAWLLFMRAVSASRLPACILVEGDTLATLEGRGRAFCIGVYGNDEIVAIVREVFSAADLPGLAPPHRRFMEKIALDAQPLPLKGHVDSVGRLITERWQPLEHDLCLRTGWGYRPGSSPTDLDTTRRAQLEELMAPRLPWRAS